MEENKNIINPAFGEVGCRFRSNIESKLQDVDLEEANDIEWLVEPLNLISYPDDLVLDAFRKGDFFGWRYELYLHERNASSIYEPFDHPVSEDILFDFDIDEELPKPSPYKKSMLIKSLLNWASTSTVPKIWKDIAIPFTELGIWQATLLEEAFTFLPKGWHGNYNNYDYIFSYQDMQNIVKQYRNNERMDASEKEKLVSFLDRKDILPSVRIDGNEAIVCFYYWSKWSGLCRRIIPVSKHDESVTFGEMDREVLAEYDCGWRY